MGGTKKKSLASMEKTQESSSAGEEEGQQQKGKKTEKKGAPPQKKQLAFLPPKMSDADLVKTLTPLRAITISTASRALGVNASIAHSVIKDLEGKEMLRMAGGFSGHQVWAVAKAS